MTELRHCLPDYDDLAAFYAPSECYTDAARAAEREAHRIACAYGFKNVEKLLDYVADRTCERWVYKTGLGELCSYRPSRLYTYRQTHWLRWLLEWNTGEERD